MASVTNVNLTVGPGSQPDKSPVTVTATANFSEADLGNWKLSIRLYGHDSSAEQTGITLGPTLLYTFKFGSSSLPIFKKDYFLVTALPGQMTINESRELRSEALDE